MNSLLISGTIIRNVLVRDSVCASCEHAARIKVSEDAYPLLLLILTDAVTRAGLPGTQQHRVR